MMGVRGVLTRAELTSLLRVLRVFRGEINLVLVRRRRGLILRRAVFDPPAHDR
jgi:hypothetical protein